MEKCVYLKEIPKEFKKTYLGSGQNGSCYLTSDGNVFKEYYTDGINDEVTRTLLELDYDGFTFPRQLVFVNEVFKGYLKQYIDGISLDNLSGLTDVKKLITALKKFEDSLKELSYDKCLYVYDLNLRNLLYTKENKIYDIDTDSISPFDFPVINPWYENMKELSNPLADSFIGGEFKSKRLADLQRECLVIGCSRPSLFMSEAISEMEKERKIETIDDYKKGLVLLKK